MKINIYIYKNDNSIGVGKDKSDILRSYDFFGRMRIYNSCGFEYIGIYQTKLTSWKEILKEARDKFLEKGGLS